MLKLAQISKRQCGGQKDKPVRKDTTTRDVLTGWTGDAVPLLCIKAYQNSATEDSLTRLHTLTDIQAGGSIHLKQALL